MHFLKNIGIWWLILHHLFFNSTLLVRSLVWYRHILLYLIEFLELLVSLFDRFWDWHEWKTICMAGNIILYYGLCVFNVLLTFYNELGIKVTVGKLSGCCQVAIHWWEEIAFCHKQAWSHINGLEMFLIFTFLGEGCWFLRYLVLVYYTGD